MGLGTGQEAQAGQVEHGKNSKKKDVLTRLALVPSLPPTALPWSCLGLRIRVVQNLSAKRRFTCVVAHRMPYTSDLYDIAAGLHEMFLQKKNSSSP